MKTMLCLLLLLMGCAQVPISVFRPDDPPKKSSFHLPTGLTVPFSDITWCFENQCQKGTDCAPGESYSSCEQRLMLTEEYDFQLSPSQEFRSGSGIYYAVIGEEEFPYLAAILYRENNAWIVVRFPFYRGIPVAVTTVVIHEKPVVQLVFHRETSVSFFPLTKTFVEEAEHPKKPKTRSIK